MTIAFIDGREFELGARRLPETPEVHAAPGLRLDYSAAGDALPSPLRSVVRNDTVFVGLEGDFGLVQKACATSYVGADLDIERVRAPAGVRAVRWTYVDSRTAPPLPGDAPLTV